MWMTAKQVSRELGMSTKTLANWRSLGKGPRYVKPEGSKLVWYPRDELDRYMSS